MNRTIDADKVLDFLAFLASTETPYLSPSAVKARLWALQQARAYVLALVEPEKVERTFAQIERGAA